MSNIKQAQLKKVYKIVLGCYSLKAKDYYEASNTDSIRVLAVDVHSAIDRAGDWILEKEREARKEEEGVFIEEVIKEESVDLV